MSKSFLEHGAPWAITEDALRDLIAAHERGDLQAVMAQRGEQPAGTALTEIRDSVAVLDVNGPILRTGGGLLSFFFQITGIDALAVEFNRAMGNPSVKAIVLHINSPGGTLSGVNEFSNQVYEARGRKPVIAYIGSTGASAAYWIASAADRIVVDATAQVGGLGIVLTTYKPSAGRIEIINTASPKKRLDPSSDAGRMELQKRVDAIADVFVEAVARNRGIEPESVVSDYGQGGILIGQAAVDAGAADELGSLEGVIEAVSSGTYTPGERHQGHQAATDDFMALVDAHQAKVGCTRTKALQAVAERHPEAHARYLKHGSGPLARPGDGFMEAVDRHQAAAGCSRSVALAAVAAKHPDLHTAFLRKQRRPEPKAEPVAPVAPVRITDDRIEALHKAALQIRDERGLTYAQARILAERQAPELSRAVG